MKAPQTSSEWSMPAVLAKLRAETGKGQRVAVQVFLQDDTPAERLSQVATEIVESAKQQVGKEAAAELGKVHPLAKSFSVRADVDTLAAVATMPNVKAILPSEVADIFPRPITVA